MTIAELHGKISSSGSNLHDQLEDLLTSDVFSACKYVRPQTLLLPFLRKASSQDGRHLSEILTATAYKATYTFWPRMSFSEPDLLIILEDEGEQYHLVMVEAKYFSGKSGGPHDDDDLQIASSPSDQLAREYKDLKVAENHMQIDSTRIVSRALVYVTAHRSFPKEAISESVREINYFFPNEDSVELYWTSWFNLQHILSSERDILNWEVKILSDVQMLLERKGFIFFHGIAGILDVNRIMDDSIYVSSLGPRSGKYGFNLQEVQPLSKDIYSSLLGRVRSYQWHTATVHPFPTFYGESTNE